MRGRLFFVEILYVNFVLTTEAQTPEACCFANSFALFVTYHFTIPEAPNQNNQRLQK